MRGLLAFVGRQLAGYGLVYTEQGRAIISGGLRPEFRGQGYGVRLFEKIMKLAKTLEVPRYRA